MPAASGQSANNIQVEAQALIADGANTAAEAGAGGVGVSGGGAGDIQRPPGVAAAMAIGEFWPSISENDIQRVVDEHRAAEQRLSDYGDTLKRKRSESPNLLQGQAGDARVERLTEMMNHAYAVADHLGSKAVTGESYKSTVVGLKTDLTRIGDAAQKAWEAAQTAKTPFSVAPYKTEAATAQSVALGDIAATPPPTPMPGEDSPRDGTQAGPTTTENESAVDEPREKADRDLGSAADTVSDAKGAGDEHLQGDQARVADEVVEVDHTATGNEFADAPAPVAGEVERPVTPLASPVTSPTAIPQMGNAGSGVGSGMGGVGSVRPPQMPTGLNPLSGSSLKDAATAPASSMSEALSSNPNLSSAASSFQSGLASGMGASGAVSPTPSLEKFAGPHPSSAAASPGGGQVPVVPAQGGGAPTPAPAAPGAPAPAGGGGMAPVPPGGGGGGGLMPYVPPGGGGGAPAPSAATLPTSAQPPGTSAPPQQSAGGPPVVASSSGSGAAAGAVAAGEPLPSAELVLARRILDGLVRGTEVRKELLNGGWVEWAVSVLALPTGQVVAIASTVGDGAYVPPGVVIPASATLAVYDHALPIDWAHRFVGVRAAAKLLAAHAEELARVTDVRPRALVSSELGVQQPREWVGEFEAVRDADIRRSPGEAPTAGGGYRHRLEAVAPDIWAKTQLVLGEAMWRRVAEAVAQTVLDEAKAVEADRPPMTPPLVDPYDRREVVERLGAGQPVDWDAHHKHVAERGVLHPDGVLDADESDVSEAQRGFYRHFYRSALIVEMLGCWRDQPVSLPDVAYCGWAAGFGHAVDGALNQALAVLEPGQRR
ncbi:MULTISPECIES: hypothetical protein [Mycobacterium]|jgi:hypothetical protein|uniref:Uncharacterized protein n=6 Tax=Mycobacteriaceae TaxID=1762 RepID=A0A1A3P4H1_MYCAS|nr:MULTISPECIES: hypothetical protein [Mycobacterium]OBK29066.1 hypothetical protein A5634_18895 [Mycobacterium asiaticum]VBA31305.1 hypothetical protein LAUMK35_04993 [Mycobacterium pseudokansasii]VBA35601.1 hypothetical protein LAUMK21_05645 [Mycobacterium pseudokansasii]BAN29105.1 hypothetical protein MAH_0031 [Mycobacterium avium subsp. hominissuis TH135]GLD38511.1 hypothetical protein Mkiyose1595_47310 [Mycobacterium kiyosense]